MTKLKNMDTFKPINIESYSHLGLDKHAGPLKPKHYDDTDRLNMMIIDHEIQQNLMLNKSKTET